MLHVRYFTLDYHHLFKHYLIVYLYMFFYITLMFTSILFYQLFIYTCIYLYRTFIYNIYIFHISRILFFVWSDHFIYFILKNYLVFYFNFIKHVQHTPGVQLIKWVKVEVKKLNLTLHSFYHMVVFPDTSYSTSIAEWAGRGRCRDWRTTTHRRTLRTASIALGGRIKGDVGTSWQLWKTLRPTSLRLQGKHLVNVVPGHISVTS